MWRTYCARTLPHDKHMPKTCESAHLCRQEGPDAPPRAAPVVWRRPDLRPPRWRRSCNVLRPAAIVPGLLRDDGQAVAILPCRVEYSGSRSSTGTPVCSVSFCVILK